MKKRNMVFATIVAVLFFGKAFGAVRDFKVTIKNECEETAYVRVSSERNYEKFEESEIRREDGEVKFGYNFTIGKGATVQFHAPYSGYYLFVKRGNNCWRYKVPAKCAAFPHLRIIISDRSGDLEGAPIVLLFIHYMQSKTEPFIFLEEATAEKVG